MSLTTVEIESFSGPSIVDVGGSGEPSIVYINQGPGGDALAAPITTASDTDLTGYIYGNGTKIAGATLGSASATASTMAIRDASGNLAAGAFLLPNGANTGTIDNATLTASRTYTMPDASGYVALTTNANGSVTNSEVYVKAGQAISAGNAVYISGASGANKIVSLAQANTDSLSSKTLGLSLQNLTTNQFGYVVTEGKLSGLSINLGAGHTVAEGDPIWLSPTTPGGLLFGLANKPSAPNHLVSIGVVTDIAGNTLTDIFVKVQNGFELGELHDVQISSPSNGQVLTYDLSTDLWKNASPQSATISTSTPTNLTGFISGNGTNISGSTTGSVNASLDTLAIRDVNAGLTSKYVRVHSSGFPANTFHSQLNSSPSITENLSFDFPNQSGVIATNNTAVMLSGAQDVNGAKTFKNQVQLDSQSVTNSSSAITAGIGDARYGVTYVGIEQNNISSTDNTPIKLTSVTLPIGMYQIDCCIASTAAANHGGFVFGLRANNAIRTTLLELYGPDSGITQNNMIPSDNLTISQRSIAATAAALTSKRQLMGLLEIVTNNTEVSIEFCQNTTTPAVPSITRKRSYIIARKIA